MHCHVLGSVLRRRSSAARGSLDVRRRRRGRIGGGCLVAGAVGLALLVLSYVPLLVHELQHDFSEIRAALGVPRRAAATPSSMSLPVRLLVVGLRVLAWPLVGLITDGARRGDRSAAHGRDRGRGLAGRRRRRRGASGPPPAGSASRCSGRPLALTVAASGLATVVPACPTTTTTRSPTRSCSSRSGSGLAALGATARATPAPGGRRPDAAAAWEPSPPVRSSSAIVGFNLVRQPPAVSPDGGWPAATRRRSGSWTRSATRRPARISSSTACPTSSQATRSGFPLVRRGASVPELDARA